MNNKSTFGPALAFIALALLLSACCTKVKCLGAYYKEIIITFRGINSSVAIEEYDKNSGLLLSSKSVSEYSAPYNSGVAKLGFQFQRPDSFYLDQRYFVLVFLSRRDTIDHITYQKSQHTINCNNCPGAQDLVTDITNFSYKYRGQTYHESDTVIVTP